MSYNPLTRFVTASTASGGICFRSAHRSNCPTLQEPLATRGSDMTRKTDGEKIDELIPLVATLNEPLDNVREELKDLKKDLDESRRRLWLIVPPLLAALLSAGLTALVNYLTKH